MGRIHQTNSGSFVVTIPLALAKKKKLRAGTEIIWRETPTGLEFRRL